VLVVRTLTTIWPRAPHSLLVIISDYCCAIPALNISNSGWDYGARILFSETVSQHAHALVENQRVVSSLPQVPRSELFGEVIVDVRHEAMRQLRLEFEPALPAWLRSRCHPRMSLVSNTLRLKDPVHKLPIAPMVLYKWSLSRESVVSPPEILTLSVQIQDALFSVVVSLCLGSPVRELENVVVTFPLSCSLDCFQADCGEVDVHQAGARWRLGTLCGQTPQTSQCRLRARHLQQLQSKEITFDQQPIQHTIEVSFTSRQLMSNLSLRAVCSEKDPTNFALLMDVSSLLTGTSKFYFDELGPTIAKGSQGDDGVAY